MEEQKHKEIQVLLTNIVSELEAEGQPTYAIVKHLLVAKNLLRKYVGKKS